MAAVVTLLEMAAENSGPADLYRGQDAALRIQTIRVTNREPNVSRDAIAQFSIPRANVTRIGQACSQKVSSRPSWIRIKSEIVDIICKPLFCAIERRF